MLSSISLFSGAGGMDVGFRSAGFDIEFANDIDPDACGTYRLNHGDKILEGSIQQLLPLKRSLKGVDLVFGGPPCQGFSVAGKMDPADERSRLIETYMDVVEAVAPQAFVCENVKALAALSRWEGVRNRLIERASKKFAVALLVLNSQHFGVPQNRERMFLIGFRKDKYHFDSYSLRALLEQRLEGVKMQAPSLRTLIKKLGKPGSASNNRLCRAKITFAKDPVLRRSAYAGMLFNGAGRPLRPDGHSSTLPASMGGNKTPIVDDVAIFENGENFVEKYHAHLIGGGKPYAGKAPSQLRRLTVDECLEFQTFPKGYQLHGSQSAMYRQIGNAVPCKLAEAVAVVTRDIIENEITSTRPAALKRAAE